MKRSRFILLVGIYSLVFCHAVFSTTKDTVVIDSITKIKLDRKLIKMAKEVVLKHGQGYYSTNGYLTALEIFSRLKN